MIGDIHGGAEWNTKTLVDDFLNYYVKNPRLIPRGLVVYFLPTVNPDGLAQGTGASSAWNAHGVDLNRNFDSGNWSSNSYGSKGGRYGPTGVKIGGGGPSPFSEPESRAIRSFVEGRRVDAVLSYHSTLRSVSAKNGGHGVGEPLAVLTSHYTGYPYIANWPYYRLTGQLVDWTDRVNVKGVDIDLPDAVGIDWIGNLRALQAAMAELVGQ